MKKLLTLEELKEMEPRTVFAHGTISDNSEGVNMSGSGRLLRWAAVRGGIHDWAIYIHWVESDEEYILDYGDKVTGEAHIKKLVPCTDEAFKMYRY